MNENLRETMMRAKMCTNCGLVDKDGGADFAGNGLYWYCTKDLAARDDAAEIGARKGWED